MKTLDGCKTLKEAKKRAPECVKFVKTSYGYLAFKSQYEYDVWRNQR